MYISINPSNTDILKANGIVPFTIGRQRPVTAEPEAEDNARQDVEEDQNASTHRIEASEVSRCFVEHRNLQGQQHHTLGQNRSAIAEPEVGAIKQEEGSRKDVEVQNAFANRIKTLEVGIVPSSEDVSKTHSIIPSNRNVQLPPNQK